MPETGQLRDLSTWDQLQKENSTAGQGFQNTKWPAVLYFQ